MIKKTLFFGSPAYLHRRNGQLVVEPADKQKPETTLPIEDLGMVVVEHQQVTISHGLIEGLLSNNVAIVTCNAQHMPQGLMLNLAAHTLHNERFRSQLESSVPLRKQLWQQTIRAKIRNQAAVLAKMGHEVMNMLHWAGEVTSGDSKNHEARAAAYYWGKFLNTDFRRDADGVPPNNMLNYGYAILRATMARSLVGAGLLPTLGIHHQNKYNAYCLADDIMEPYRPYVDVLVHELFHRLGPNFDLPKEAKTALLKVPALDVFIGGSRSPLMLATQQTAVSLVKCFEGQSRLIEYPVIDS